MKSFAHLRLRSNIAVALATGACLLGLSACGSPASVSTTTTTTTSTTLPPVYAITATQPTGSAGFEGPIYRVAVAPLANGANVLPVRPATERVVSGIVKIAYRQFGSGPNLVLAMGEHGSMSWWDPAFLNALSQDYRVTIFDDPAVGYSAAMNRAPSVQTDGDVMAGLIASIGLTNVTVLGWGMGGEAALSMVERHPRVAIGLVLVDATSGGPDAVRPSPRVATVFATPTSTVPQLASVMYPATAAGYAARNFWTSDITNVEPDDVLFSAVQSQAAAQNAFFRDSRVARLVPTISLPTLIFQGGLDQLIPKANSAYLHSHIRGARLIVDPRGGYAALFQDRTAFVGDLSTFMARVTTTTTTTTTP